MPLRRRITLVAAATVAVAVAIAVIVSYFAVRRELFAQVDNSLRAQAATVLNSGTISLSQPLPGASPRMGGPAPYQQVVFTNGTSQGFSGSGTLPDSGGVLHLAKSVATHSSGPTLRTVRIDDTKMRVYLFGMTLNYQFHQLPVAIQLAQPLNGVDNVLGTMRWLLALVFLLVVGLAALLARTATRRVLQPLADVTATAQLIGKTDDLSQRIDVQQDDEVGQLAGSFNEMLERLEKSRAELDSSVTAQRQLVADASHELRTPVTSLRTNVEVLLSGAQLEEDDRDRLLADIVEQSEELSALVTDLIEVARGDTPPTNIEDTRLDRLVEEAIDRARRNTADVEFVEDLQPVSVQGSPERLMRAINNLLDNAALHGGRRGPVEATVDQSGLTVRDHGDGIPEADLAHVFDRFFRGANSRSRQGSGLGLAIVSQVAQQHHGTITVANAPDGGAVFRLQLPTTPATDDARVTHHAEISA